MKSYKTEFAFKQSKCSKYRRDLLHKTTNSEKITKIMLEELGIKFIEQKGFIQGNYFCIVDFYIPLLRLCLEIDGGYHSQEQQIRKDFRKDNYLRDRGFNVLRITNEQISIFKKEDLLKIINSIS